MGTKVIPNKKKNQNKKYDKSAYHNKKIVYRR
jgi:hypothetical protein